MPNGQQDDDPIDNDTIDDVDYEDITDDPIRADRRPLRNDAPQSNKVRNIVFGTVAAITLTTAGYMMNGNGNGDQPPVAKDNPDVSLNIITGPTKSVDMNPSIAVVATELTVHDPNTLTNHKEVELRGPLAAFSSSSDDRIADVFSRVLSTDFIMNPERVISIDETWGRANRADGYGGKLFAVNDVKNPAFETPKAQECVADSMRLAEQHADRLIQQDPSYAQKPIVYRSWIMEAEPETEDTRALPARIMTMVDFNGDGKDTGQHPDDMTKIIATCALDEPA